MAEITTKSTTRAVPVMKGPVVWWVRNDLRLQDNPCVRGAAGVGHTDQRQFAAVFVFDPRFLDKSPYGRVTDPNFEKSIATRKKVTFCSRKTNALRARFWLQSVLKLREQLEAKGMRLLVCHGKPEDVLGGLPEGSEVKTQSEPVSIEQTDVEGFVERRLRQRGGKLRRDHGAMNLYHPHDLPFRHHERPDCYSALGQALGWKDIWTSAEQHEWAAPIRPTVPAPSAWPSSATDLELPGEIPNDVLLDEAAALKHLGYSAEEIAQAQGQHIPEGGEIAARARLEEWVKDQNIMNDNAEQTKAIYWDLPCGGQQQADAGADPYQWRNLSTPHGWLRLSHYLAIGCISAREILERAAETPNYAGVAHRLLWRDFHRLYCVKYHRQVAWLQGPAKVERSWSQDPEVADAWKKGLTGVPYIDACQRELQQTGWLAYKGRKTAAHFLVHDLGMDWRIGAFHDEETLFDYDFAMNYGNWGVVAKLGNGAWDGSREVDEEHWDLRFKLRAEQENDSSGAYIRRWVPELRNVDAKFIHTPWVMSETEMEACGCVVGKDYPASLLGPLDTADCVPEHALELPEGAPAERRLEPYSKKLYSFEEFREAYGGEFDEKEIRNYWHRRMPLVDPGEKRMDPERNIAMTFDEVVEAYKDEFDIKDCHKYWSRYMTPSTMAEKRMDPERNIAMTFDEVVEAYKDEFDIKDCGKYWSRYMTPSTTAH